MTKRTLKIQFTDGVSDELKALSPAWLDEVVSWHLSQPRATGIDGEHPAFEELQFTIGNFYWSYGLRKKSTGVGWENLCLSSDIVMETRPITVIPSTIELGSKVRWCYLLSQLFRGENHFDSDFRQQEHYQYQLKYFQEVAPDLAKDFTDAQRAKRLKNQRQEKHQLQLKRRHQLRQPQQPKRYQPHYSPAPEFVPAPTPPREAVPSPELNEFEALAVARHKAMVKFVEQEAAQTCSID